MSSFDRMVFSYQYVGWFSGLFRLSLLLISMDLGAKLLPTLPVHGTAQRRPGFSLKKRFLSGLFLHLSL